jgi:acyl-CoA reductase-like NAD-dependent aldehyde dehydrogenase
MSVTPILTNPVPTPTKAKKRAAEACPEPAMIPCREPATGRWLGEVPVTRPEELTEVLRKARRAQEVWARTPFSERRKVLGLVLEHLLAHADELCETIVREAGKTCENAMLGEIWPVAEKLRWTIAQGEKHLRPERVSSGLFVHKRATIHYEPLGVIGVICPWNYPLQNVLGPAIPALMAGNAVIAKVSEWTSWSGERFQRIFDAAFAGAGYPRDLVQIVYGYAATGKALVTCGVDKLIFTGSMRNGKSVLAESAATLTPTVLELGGKDALYVCDDAHLEQAVHAALAGVFIHAGQNCLASERILVHERIWDDFTGAVVSATQALVQGPPLDGSPVDVAAIVSPLQLDRIEKLVQEAVAAGARVLAGGKRAAIGVGQYFEPTVLTDLTPEMRIMVEEVFGPVMLLCRVRDDAEAVALANRTPYGLGATILTRDPERARRLARELVVGQVSINDFAMTYMAQDLPFGGAKGSGFGRLNGREGLRAMTNPKSILEDRWSTGMPAKLYPVRTYDYDLARGIIRTIYSTGLQGRLAGLVEAARFAWRRARAKQ